MTLQPSAVHPPSRPHPPSRVRPGLSLWDAHVLDLDSTPEYADLEDLGTGYADQTCAASGSAPYRTKSRTFFVCPQGFTALAERMAARVEDVRYDHHVADVVCGDSGTPSSRIFACRSTARRRSLHRAHAMMAEE